MVLASAAVAGWFWPGLLPAVLYGAAPGVLIMSVLWLVQWLLHERYKRQLLYLPGFTRLHNESLLLKAAAKQPRPEPSTIDAPRALVRGSSFPGSNAEDGLGDPRA